MRGRVGLIDKVVDPPDVGVGMRDKEHSSVAGVSPNGLDIPVVAKRGLGICALVGAAA